MTENNSLVPLARVATEVEESQTKLHLFNICIKAQQELAHKLHKEAQRRKEICNFTRNSNIQLEAEIRNAGQEINSLQMSLSSIKTATVLLRKELLVSKQNYLDTVEHMRKGEKKYEEFWIQSKNRYESIPFVQKWLQTIKKCEMERNNIMTLEKEAQIFCDKIKSKKLECMLLDRGNIIKLAEYLCRQRPYLINMYKDMSNKKIVLKNEVNMSTKLIEAKNKNLGLHLSIDKLNLRPSEITEDSGKEENEGLDLDRSDDSLMMPSLQLSNSGLDILNVKLQINKIGSHEQSLKRPDYATDLDKNLNKRLKDDDNFKNNYISSYFNKPVADAIEDANFAEGNNMGNYSQRKLINILDDVKIDKQEAYEIVSKANPVKLLEINEIGGSAAEETPQSVNNKKVAAPITSEIIEEIDLTQPSSQNLIVPPTQFLNQSQENNYEKPKPDSDCHISLKDASQQGTQSQRTSFYFKSSQETKKVTFDIPMSMQDVEMEESDVSRADETNETISEIGNTSIVTDDNYNKIKDLILKKNNLDLSPQFTYAKTNVLPKKNEENLITSKFFQKISSEIQEDQPRQEENIPKLTEIITSPKSNLNSAVEVENRPSIETDNAASSPKSPVLRVAKPVTGLLYNHGPQGLPESLDVSMSTTGFEETDADFPTCLDSSLLLSPKADLPPPSDMAENIGSQEVPNFLTGFRKTGLFFFGQQPEPGPSANNSQSQENNFSFNFGGQDKKAKGGLFSFFR